MIPRRQKTLLGWMLAVLGVLLVSQVTALWPKNSAETAVAVRYDGDEPVLITGVVIRQETVISVPVSGSWVAAVGDGEKVARGQTILTWEQPQSQTQAAIAVRVCRAGAEAAELPLPQRRKQIKAMIAQLSAAKDSDRKDLSEQLTGLLLGENSAVEDKLAEAEQTLLDTASGAGQTVSAPEAGIFVSTADGLESLLTPDTPDASWTLPLRPVSRTEVGRLITSDTWCFRAALPFCPEVGDTLDAELLSGIFEDREFTVERVTPTASGSEVLLSCREQVAEVAGLRSLSAKFFTDSESGLEIPAQAVYTVGEETGVWCQVGADVQWKPVTVLKYVSGSAVVALDESSTDNLWPGDTVYLNHEQE